MALFALVERHRAEPLLELRFFRSRPFTGASVIAVLAFTVIGNRAVAIDIFNDPELVAKLDIRGISAGPP